MSDKFKGIEPMVYKSTINIPYSWWAGDTATRFFVSLRDDTRIIATRCGGCGTVFMPPRKVCPACFTENSAWVNVFDEGVLLSFSVARRRLEGIPKDKKVPVI